MAWVTPTDVATGDVLTAAKWNQDVVANAEELAPLFGAWTTFVPQLRTSTTNRTSTVTSARYLQIGTLLIVQASVVATAAGGANEQVNLALPTGFTYAATPGDDLVCGTFMVKDTGTAYYTGNAMHFVSGYIYGQAYNSVAPMGQSAPAMTLASNDEISYTVMLEVTI